MLLLLYSIVFFNQKEHVCPSLCHRMWQVGATERLNVDMNSSHSTPWMVPKLHNGPTSSLTKSPCSCHLVCHRCPYIIQAHTASVCPATSWKWSLEMGTNLSLEVHASLYVQHQMCQVFPSPSSLANDPLTSWWMLLSSSSLAVQPVHDRSTGLPVLPPCLGG